MCKQILKIKKVSQELKITVNTPIIKIPQIKEQKRNNNDRSPQESSQPLKSIKMDNQNCPIEETTNLMILGELKKLTQDLTHNQKF